MGVVVFNDGQNSNVIRTVDNGLTASTSTNAELGGLLIKDTTIDVNGFLLLLRGLLSVFAINDTQIQLNRTSVPNVQNVFIRNANVQVASSYDSGIHAQIMDMSATSWSITDTVNNKGLEYSADYSAAGSLNNLWLPNIGYVRSLIAALNPKIVLEKPYVNVPVWVFTGSAPSGVATNVYTWTQMLNIVTCYITGSYTVAGVGVTGLTLPLPVDLPTPAIPTNIGNVANGIISVQQGKLSSSAGGNGTTSFTTVLRVNGTATGFEINLVANAGVGALVFWIKIIYDV